MISSRRCGGDLERKIHFQVKTLTSQGCDYLPVQNGVDSRQQHWPGLVVKADNHRGSWQISTVSRIKTTSFLDPWHNSDLRDYKEYIQKHVRGEQIWLSSFELFACSIVFQNSAQPAHLESILSLTFRRLYTNRSGDLVEFCALSSYRKHTEIEKFSISLIQFHWLNALSCQPWSIFVLTSLLGFSILTGFPSSPDHRDHEGGRGHRDHRHHPWPWLWDGQAHGHLHPQWARHTRVYYLEQNLK